MELRKAFDEINARGASHAGVNAKRTFAMHGGTIPHGLFCKRLALLCGSCHERGTLLQLALIWVDSHRVSTQLST